MLGAHFRRCRRIQHFDRGRAGSRNNRPHFGSAKRKGAGFVEDDGVHPAQSL
jgi:hypothetical protein